MYEGSPAIFRSKKVMGEWATPELIVSNFAGEPTLDSKGNLYFVHHFYRDGRMIEADIYVAKKKVAGKPAEKPQEAVPAGILSRDGPFERFDQGFAKSFQKADGVSIATWPDNGLKPWWMVIGVLETCI